MQYLEDIIELIEDVPDELQRRGGLIQDWERQAAEYKHQADKLSTRLHTDVTLKDDEKAVIFRQIAEMLDRARDATQKKCDMAAKCHRLVQALCERVTEYTYHCKLELEVDAPGCTPSIEHSFLTETLMAAAAASNLRGGHAGQFRVPEEKSREVAGSSRESTPMGGRGGANQTRHRNQSRASSVASSRSSSVQPYDQNTAAAQMQQRKRKRDREREKHLQREAVAAAAADGSQQSKDPVIMTNYMRKKREREREERKLREVHANREKTSQQRVIKPEPADDGYETVATPPAKQTRRVGRPPGQRLKYTNECTYLPPTSTSEGGRREEERREEADRDDGSSLNAGGMSDVDDDDLLKILADEMPGGMADHGDLNLGLEDENLFDMASFGADLGKALEKIQKERPPSPLGQNVYGTLNAPSISSADKTRYSNKSSSKAEIKRQQMQQQQQRQYVSFGAGESMHGRPRKLTNRAEEMLGEMERKEKQRRLRDEESGNGGVVGTSSSYGNGGGRRNSSHLISIPEEWTPTPEDDADNSLYCYCQQPSDGTMVGCDSERCMFKWFHLTCLNMLSPPESDPWYCPECRRKQHRLSGR